MAPIERENPIEPCRSILGRAPCRGICSGLLVYLGSPPPPPPPGDKEPVIGVVKEVTDDAFKIYYWKGTYRGKWHPQNLPRSQEPWTEMLPKECIIVHAFELTDAMP